MLKNKIMELNSSKKITAMMVALFLCITLQAQELSGVWKGKLQVGPQSLTLILHLDQEAQTASLDVIEQGATNIPMSVTVLTNDSVNASVDQAGINISGSLSHGKINAMFCQMTFVAPLLLERGTLARPQEPKAPYPYETKEVKFENKAGGASLAGTLTFPIGYTQGQKVPVALMVSGSGQQNRDEEIFGHKPFLVIADHLARHGIATLRYDDRGVGGSTGPVDSATTADFAQDAEAGLAYLHSLGCFSHVGVIGHSEGGAIAYMLASEGKTDFIVSLAGPAGKIDELMVLQLNGLARAQGATADIVHSPEEARQTLLHQADNAWMRYFLNMDMRPYIKKVNCPVLALSGEKDLNVPAAATMTSLMFNLPKNPKNKMKVYPGLSHTFQPSQTGNPIEYSSCETTFSEDVIRDMVEWIQSL